MTEIQVATRTVCPETERLALQGRWPEGYEAIAARLIAGRVQVNDSGGLRELFGQADPSMIPPPEGLPDVEPAAQRIVEALAEGESIALVTDHDADGVTANCVLQHALRAMGVAPEALTTHIGHRLTEGYGLSDPVVDRILALDRRPGVVITADIGSTDEPRIARLRAKGIDVVVTDHHGMPEAGPPASALATINPTRDDSEYDPRIAGVMVAWLLMLAVQRAGDGRLSEQALSVDLSHLLDFVAVGTHADCVSLGESAINRQVVRYGLSLMREGLRPCWRALDQRETITLARLSAKDIGWKIGPRLNAVGRLGDALDAVAFLMSETQTEALGRAGFVEEQNTRRKAIQDAMAERALADAAPMVEQGYHALVLADVEGHAGVHGIAASRVCDTYGRATAIFSPMRGSPGVWTASLRGAPGVHIRDALAEVQAKTGVLLHFGGHEGAGGCRLKEPDMGRFMEAFEPAVAAQLAAAGEQPGRRLVTDGVLPMAKITPTLLKVHRMLEPYGQGFDEPVYTSLARVQGTRWVGRDKTHLQVELQDFENGRARMIQFNAEVAPEAGATVAVAFTVSENHYQGRIQASAQVKHLLCREGRMLPRPATEAA